MLNYYIQHCIWFLTVLNLSRSSSSFPSKSIFLTPKSFNGGISAKVKRIEPIPYNYHDFNETYYDYTDNTAYSDKSDPGDLSNVTHEELSIRMGVFLPFYGTKYPFTLEKMYGNLLLAYRRINEQFFTRDIIVKKFSPSLARYEETGKRLRISLRLIFADTASDGELASSYDECTEDFATYHAGRAFYKYKISAFLGPFCYLTFASVAYLATRWNLPIITSMGSGYVDAKTWPTLVRMSYRSTDLAGTYLSILISYGWTDYSFIYENDAFERIGIDGLDYSQLLLQNDEYGPKHIFTMNTTNSHDVLRALMSGSVNSRVFILALSVNLVKQFLLSAYDLGMLVNGEYVFLTLELWKCACFGGSFFTTDETESRINDLRKAYESLFVITPKMVKSQAATEYNQVLKNFSRSLSYFGYNFTPNEETNLIVTGMYDGLYVYAKALKEHLENGGTNFKGADIAKRMKNQTVQSDIGNFTINEDGDRITDYYVWDFDPKQKIWKVEIQSSNNFKKNEVVAINIEIAMTYYSEMNNLVPENVYTIHWPIIHEAPPNIPVCGFGINKAACMPSDPITFVELLTYILALFVLVGILLAYIAYKKMTLESELNSRWWEAKFHEIKYEKLNPSYLSLVKNKTAPEGMLVNISTLDVDWNFVIKRSNLLEFKYMRDIQNTNLCRFIALCVEMPRLYVLMEYCSKGTLHQILENADIQIDMEMKIAILKDIVSGMNYLHLTPIEYHGNLRSTECWIDSRFAVKISGYGLNSIRIVTAEETDNDIYYYNRLYVAPELLRSDWHDGVGTQKGDVYSFAIIMQEVLLRSKPYEAPKLLKDSNSVQNYKEIVENVQSQREICFRPNLYQNHHQDIPNEWFELTKACWDENPDYRPNFLHIQTVLRRLSKGKNENVVDSLLKRLEDYSNNLEVLVQERTNAYIEQKQRSDDLLYRIIPKSVVERLKMGYQVLPENYEQVTIYFSDIVGFTSLSAESTPFQIINFLNDLYTCFDTVLTYFDVYKVETIGDAYMVVSGLPIRNNNHAVYIARVALCLLYQIMAFKIRHKPNKKLKLRIGLHSGPVAAGVVGLKMPRYCLFGHTVFQASCMESSGEGLKIHVSDVTKAHLDKYGGFVCEPRGKTAMKDGTTVETFWLLGEQDSTKQHKMITYDLKRAKACAKASKMNMQSEAANKRGRIIPSAPDLATDDQKNLRKKFTVSLTKLENELVAKSMDFILSPFRKPKNETDNVEQEMKLLNDKSKTDTSETTYRPTSSEFQIIRKNYIKMQES